MIEKSKSSVAFVILNWNDPKNTFQLIKSIFDNNHKQFDVYLVDNNSNQEFFELLIDLIKSDGLNYEIILDKKILSKSIFPEKKIFIIRSTEVSNIKYAKNVGVSRGYNKGINLALKYNYNYLMKLDCDFIIDKDLVGGLIKTIEENENCVAASPKVYYFKDDKKTNIIWWKGVNFNKNYFRFQRTGKGGDRKILDVGQYTGVHRSEGICGCCVMFKKDILNKTGVLDEDFFFGPEDIEHSFRLRKFGEILINHDLKAYHKVSQSIFISGIESRIYFETIGWLTLVKKVCKKTDVSIAYIYFFVRFFLHLVRYLYKKENKAHKGFILGIKDYFF